MVQEMPVNPSDTPKHIRVRFYKMGLLQYISHLDLVRTVTRALVRSKIPAWYSQGFNPRLKLTFGMPLSIGCQSEREFFDIRLTEDMDFAEIKRRLNENFTEELQVTEVYESDHKFSEIGWAEYEISMVGKKLDSNTAEELKKLYSESLTVVKRSKNGDKEVNIAPFIRLKECSFDGGKIRISALLSADSANYLNPEYLIKAAVAECGITFDDPFSEYYDIVRKEVYFADGVTVFR